MKIILHLLSLVFFSFFFRGLSISTFQYFYIWSAICSAGTFHVNLSPSFFKDYRHTRPIWVTTKSRRRRFITGWPRVLIGDTSWHSFWAGTTQTVEAPRPQSCTRQREAVLGVHRSHRRARSTATVVFADTRFEKLSLENRFYFFGKKRQIRVLFSELKEKKPRLPAFWLRLVSVLQK